MYKAVFIVLLFSAALFALDFSGDTLISPVLKELLINVPSHDKFSNSSFYVVTDSMIATMLPGGGYVFERYYLAKSYTYRGKKALSNYKILYNPAFEELELIRARTINDSIVSPVGAKEANEINPPEYSDATVYANMTQMVTSMPAFNESSAIEIHYKIKSKGILPVPFGGARVLLDEEPARKVYFALSFPQGETPRWISVSGAPEPTVSAGQAQWIIQNWEGKQFEPQIPPIREIMPTVIYSASKNWENEAEKIASAILTAAVADEKIKALVDSLSEGKSLTETAEALLLHLQEKLEHIYINPNLVGYKPNTAATVLNNGYGDCRDLAVLLISMLKVAKIEAFPALVSAGGATIYDIPTTHQFSLMVVAATIEGKTILLNPSSQFAEIGFLGGANGEKAFVISPGKSKLIDIPPIDLMKNTSTINNNFILQPDGSITGTIIAEAVGSPAQGIRQMFRHAKKSRKRQNFEKAAANVADGAKLNGEPKIEGVETNSGATRVEIGLSAKDFLAIQGNMAILWLPPSPFELWELPDISKEKRVFPLFISEPSRMVNNYNFSIPNTYKIDYLPPIEHYENEAGSLDISSQMGERTLSVSVALQLKTKRITPDIYEKLKQLVRSVSAKKYRIVLLESQS